ncbi:MAG: hypothetical protein K2J84_01295, partial [Bacteroidaceae bacterium]|nr:hypothetical protein [Bacteroidaceae bacterium]
ILFHPLTSMCTGFGCGRGAARSQPTCSQLANHIIIYIRMDAIVFPKNAPQSYALFRCGTTFLCFFSRNRHAFKVF